MIYEIILDVVIGAPLVALAAVIGAAVFAEYFMNDDEDDD